MSRLFARKTLLGLGILATLVLIITVNIIGGNLLRGVRLDLTQTKLYTLSPATERALQQIEEPITLRLFISDRLTREVPSFAAYAQRVRDLLRDYAAGSRGRLTVEVLSPDPFSPIEDRAVAYGLQGVPIDQGGEQVYFGLVGANSTDDQEVIAFFAPERERFLEYDLTKMVAKLARPKQRTVGLISTLPITADPAAQQQGGSGTWLIYDQISQNFKVQMLETTVTQIPADIDVLWLVHPANLPPATLYAIDQFVLKGGRALVMVDPVSEAAVSRGRMLAMQGVPGPASASALEPLFKAWGVQLVADKVVADRRNARKVSAGGAATRVQAADYLAWLSVPKAQLAENDSLTGDLQSLSFASAGILEPVEGATTKLTPLASSSVVSMKLAADKVRGQPDILGILRGFQSEGQALTMAARVTGPAKTAYPDALPEGAAAEGRVMESQQPLNLVIVADTDMLEERFWAQTQNFFGQKVAVPVAGNGDFIANALDNLAGGSTLSGLTARTVIDRPFTAIRALEQAAENSFRAKEQELQDRIKETEKKLADLRGREAPKKGQPQTASLTPEQAKEIETFRADLIRTRAELRDVQLALRTDIEALQTRIRLWVIGAVPVALVVFALGLGVWRRQRARRAAQAQR